MSTPSVDVAIIGAGISGLNAAYRVQTQCPGRTYTILESRTDIGGTWDLFKYPGIRSDSDLHTFGFAWRPWRQSSAIAEAPLIKSYLRDAITSYGIDRKINFQRRVRNADWSSKTSEWTLQIENASGNEKPVIETLRCKFLYLGTGYYDYYSPLDVDIPGLKSFKGQIIHPQFWPANLDVTDKEVVIIGSGATAITLLPNLAKAGARTTMLQRSPGYIFSQPQLNDVATLQRIMPVAWAMFIIRWTYLLVVQIMYDLCRAFPAASKRMLMNAAAKQLPKGMELNPTFNPRYNPWDERLCVCPDGDFYKSLHAGSHPGTARVLTAHIATVTPDSIQLKDSPEVLHPDIIVTATGLRVQFAGGIQIAVDGKPFDFAANRVWKATLVEGLPNAAISIGYINASWTLGADCAAMLVTRVLNRMQQNGHRSVVPVVPEGEDIGSAPFWNLNSTYVKKALQKVPKSGSKGVWRPRTFYIRDYLVAVYGTLTEGLVYQ